MDIDINVMKKIMKKLSSERPIFYSEADFQFGLAWKIKEYTEEKGIEAKIRLEFPCPFEEPTSGAKKRRRYIDILAIVEGKWIPIELKYKTKQLEYNDQKTYNSFNLKTHGAQDEGRYDFLKDIWRLEEFKEDYKEKCGQGYAIFLTNASSYFKDPSRTNSTFVKFKLTGEIGGGRIYSWNWKGEPKCAANRIADIKLKKVYNNVKEELYSTLDNDSKHSVFQYLIVEV